MAIQGLGDRAQLFASLRQNFDLRTRMATLTQEMGSEQAADMVAHLRGDTAPLADLDRRLALADSYRKAAQETGSRLKVMQDALDRTEAARAGLLDSLMAPDLVGRSDLASQAARGAFDDIVSALNTGLGGAALFAGTSTGSAALASASIMMTALQGAVAGATTADEVAQRLDHWFGDPAGGFATLGFLGTPTDAMRAVDADVTVALAPRADAAALRNLLKAAALAALAGDGPSTLATGEDTKLLTRSRDALLSVAVPLTEVRATLGEAQARTEEAVARHAARHSAWTVLRNEMTQIDPFATASKIEALRTQLQSHYELTNRLSSLNLVSFLR